MEILLGLFLLCLIAIAYLIVRTGKVTIYLMKITDKVYLAGSRDIHEGQDYWWRYDVLDSVTYEQMLFSFRPLDSFFPDKSFIE